MVYRRTPCPSSPNSRSPAENFLGRPLRSTLSMLNPPRSILKNRDEKMEQQFNRHHNARPKQFEPEDLVWVRDYRLGQTKWISGKVLLRLGNALYDVLVNDNIVRRHANQLRRRETDDTPTMLWDDFDWPQPSSPSPSQSSSSSSPPSPSQKLPPSDNDVPAALRRSERHHQPPKRLNMDPSLKSYV
ncbi:unnamed protein product [Caenorhabditis auriculariae]|uniref:Uncharacterized protein n=1 Tax=Caenorhabditis auriculariae TaxID=2777116 RepID=A0A8S1HPU5_9PELO|nr:unnamed protein product [Caenorhabditis auriculariae]